MSNIEWDSQVDFAPAGQSLRQLQEGYRRFRTKSPSAVSYTPERIGELWQGQHPIAAVITCSDSRVCPEIIFDQPLGSLFVSRVPGNVASDSAKWMLDIAVAELKVPLVLVVGHLGCLAVRQMVENHKSPSGGTLKLDVQMAVERARAKQPADVFRQSVIENVYLTIENLTHHASTIGTAIKDHTSILMGAIYDMESGLVELLPHHKIC